MCIGGPFDIVVLDVKRLLYIDEFFSFRLLIKLASVELSNRRGSGIFLSSPD